jgi:hypothetical protein
MMWSEKRLYKYPFNPNPEAEDKAIMINRDYVDIECGSDIKRILDFGVKYE